MAKTDYQRELDRILDQVHGDEHDERVARFRAAWDEAIHAGVDVAGEVDRAFRAYDDFTSGKHKKIGDVNLHRALVDGGVVHPLDAAINFLRAAIQESKARAK